MLLVGQMRGTCKTLIGNSEGKIQLVSVDEDERIILKLYLNIVCKIDCDSSTIYGD